MKRLLLLLFILPTIAIAQSRTYTGNIIDEATLVPVDIVTVSATGTNIITVSNIEGRFRITIPESVSELQFTHLNYKPFSLKLEPGKSELSILLQPNEFVLDEVVLSDRPINEMLGEVLSASKKKIEKSILMNTYYREFVKLNGDYTKYSDGMLDYNVKTKKGSSDLYIRQSRGFALKEPKVANQSSVQDALYMFDVRDAISEGYNFTRLNFMLKSKNYDYQLRLKTDAAGRSVQIIEVTPKEGVNFVAYTARVVYDPATKLVLEMDFSIADQTRKYIKEVNALILKFTIYEDKRKSMYKLDGDKYIMTYNQNKMKFHVKMGKQVNDTFEFLSDLVTIDYKEGEFDLDRKLRHKERSLFAAGTKYTEEFWKTANIMLLSDAEEQVLKSLK